MADRVTYVGHATVLLRLSGRSVLTDPVLGRRIGHIVRRAAPPPGDVLDPPLLVLVSHAHRDHLDLASLARLPAGTPVIAPRGAGRHVRRLGGLDVHEAEAGDALELDGVAIRAVPAEHDGRRTPFGRPAPALGYLVERGRRVYFAGDTDLFDGLAEAVGEHDVALLPVSGWGPRLGPGHLDPERAAEAVVRLRPRLAVPIHWGTFWPAGLGAPSAAALNGPPRAFAAAVAERAPGVEVAVLAPGESRALADDEAAA